MAYADKILSGGNILTMDQARPSAQAVAIRDGRIVAVGSVADVAPCRGPGTADVDLDGATLMPGFVEAHGHPFWSSQAWGEPVVDIRAIHVPTYAAALEKMKRRAAKARDGEVLWFLGLDPALHQGMKEPTREDLDAISARNAIVVQTSNFHAAFINSRAAELFGIGDDYQAPEGGKVFRDDRGRPWKLHEMAAWSLGERFHRMLSADCKLGNLDEWQRKFVRAGYTTSSDILLAPGTARPIAQALARLPKWLRIVGYEAMAAGGAVSVPQGPVTDMFTMTGVKFHADGSVLLGNVWTSAPYLNNEMTLQGMGLPRDSTGHALYDFDALYARVRRYAGEGWQVAIHAHGDRTIDLALDVFERVLRECGRVNGPFRLEHCGLMREDQIDRALSLGVVASFFLPYIYHWGEALRDCLLGREAAERFVPSGSATARGMRVSYHCDAPMTWPDALKCLYVAVTRKTMKGAVLGGDQRVSMAQALRALTVDAAYHLRMEHEIGSIGVGKLADFVVLGADPLSWDPEDIMSLPILGTYVGGEATAP